MSPTRRARLGRPALATLLALIALGCLRAESSAPDVEGWVEIGRSRVGVEVAEDRATQAKGLGGRDALPWGRGMYFLYSTPNFYAFWMKGMRFSIDIVWIREGRIVDLSANVPFEPGGNGPTVRPRSLVDAVLEVPAGFAAAEGWRIGDRVRFERVEAP